MTRHDDVPYLPEEDEYILRMRKKGAAYRTIAYDLDRASWSIRQRFNELERRKNDDTEEHH